MIDNYNRTLALPLKDGEVWLGAKKRGHGAGRLNGFGGKLELGESIEEAMIRECRQEAGITPTEYQKRAELWFFNAGVEAANSKILLHAYVCTDWEGEFIESEEMSAAQPYPLDELPTSELWPADTIWLPRILLGESVRGEIWLASTKSLVAKEIETVIGFGG